MLSRERGRECRAAAAMVVLLLGMPARAQIIDRILAVVSGALILQSDAVAAQRLHLVEIPEVPDKVQGALDRLIERRLMLLEVDRYGPPEPSPADIDASVAAVLGKLGPGDTVEAIFRETGYSQEQVR